MGKYIKTKDLELEVSHYLQCEKESEAITLEELKEITSRLPSADVVDVVRCKDCEHGEAGVSGVWCYLYAAYRCSDAFCDNGEPKSTTTTELETEGGKLND